MFLLVLIPLAIYLLISYIIAKKFEDVAFRKGYDSSIDSFAMCFWLGIVGYLYVIALPDLSAHHNEAIPNTDSAKQSGKIELPSNPSEMQIKYYKLVEKAEKFKDTFYDRDFRIRTYESIVEEMGSFASVNFEDSVTKLEEYKSHLNLLKARKIK